VYMPGPVSMCAVYVLPSETEEDKCEFSGWCAVTVVMAEQHTLQLSLL
jgi:hypothetical protein